MPSDLYLKIVQLLQKGVQGTYDLARTLHQPHQTIDYHLKRMIEDGIVLRQNGTAKRVLFSLQPFYNQTADHLDKLWQTIEPLLEHFTDHADFSQATSKADAQLAMIDYLICQLHDQFHAFQEDKD